VIGLATTTVSILRGTAVDDYGDENDTTTVAATRIPASILEQRRLVSTPDDPQPRAVVFYTARVLATTDVRTGDRIRDETTGEVFIVDNHTRVSNPFIANDIRLDLRLVT
jgi:hypothetical protein